IVVSRPSWVELSLSTHQGRERRRRREEKRRLARQWGGTEAEAEAITQGLASDTTTLANPGLVETDAPLPLLVSSFATSPSTPGQKIFESHLNDLDTTDSPLPDEHVKEEQDECDRTFVFKDDLGYFCFVADWTLEMDVFGNLESRSLLILYFC
ncbi:hypothetical protein HYC85_020484, partial [Camellia sinensis]